MKRKDRKNKERKKCHVNQTTSPPCRRQFCVLLLLSFHLARDAPEMITLGISRWKNAPCLGVSSACSLVVVQVAHKEIFLLKAEKKKKKTKEKEKHKKTFIAPKDRVFRNKGKEIKY
jgi:hypothetical protein